MPMIICQPFNHNEKYQISNSCDKKAYFGYGVINDGFILCSFVLIDYFESHAEEHMEESHNH